MKETFATWEFGEDVTPQNINEACAGGSETALVLVQLEAIARGKKLTEKRKK